MITTAQIRSLFTAFFHRKGHTILPSSSLIPAHDPTLLFTNAGMVQFKTIFQGKEQPLYPTASTIQKCMRAGGKHNDLDNVGRTSRHHTFFEMLGNFSFGAYFKKEAITYAWEFLTQDLALDPNRLYVSVFIDDDEAYALWQSECGLAPSRIFKLGEDDNFWSMGETGPCGPCSEIFFDQGESLSCGPSCGIGTCDCDRFLEIWNLVFMQFDMLPDGTKIPLPHPSIDTGSGLERLTAVCQGVASNYDTDIFTSIINYIASLTGGAFSYTKSNVESDTAMRVIADHSRAIAFMLADGILPSNEGRGYVVRRILRRAYRFGRELDLREPFLYKVVRFVSELMSDAYPELLSSLPFTLQLVEQEESAFNKTLDKGLILLEDMIADIRSKNYNRLCGKKAFLLHDTYGFPIDIVNDIVEQAGYSVDLPEFEACINEQKERARASWKGDSASGLEHIFTALGNHSATEFCGYDNERIEGTILQLYNQEGSIVESLHEGDYGYCIVDRSVFYGTAGGQESDMGTIESSSSFADCFHADIAPSGVLVHSIYVRSGSLTVSTPVVTAFSLERRSAIAKNHTATHLAFAALRAVVSPHIRQAGSLVTAEKLRFDYTTLAPLSAEDIIAVERKVNEYIQQAIPSSITQMKYDDAIQQGAVSLAGEQYSDTVRVITFGDCSKELCCGTHVENTGMIGSFIIVSDSSLSTGVRRIEAVTGMHALTYMQEQRNHLTHTASLLKTPQNNIINQIEHLFLEKKNLLKQIEVLEQASASSFAKELLTTQEVYAHGNVLLQVLPHTSVQMIQLIIDNLRPHFEDGIIALATTVEQSITLLIYTGSTMMQKHTARSILSLIASHIDAKGGGKPHLVQAGGKNPDGITLAFKTIRKLVQ